MSKNDNNQVASGCLVCIVVIIIVVMLVRSCASDKQQSPPQQPSEQRLTRIEKEIENIKAQLHVMEQWKAKYGTPDTGAVSKSSKAISDISSAKPLESQTREQKTVLRATNKVKSERQNKEYNEFLCNALYQMLHFRYHTDFWKYMWGVASPYRWWYDGIIKYSKETKSISAMDIVTIATDYANNYGKETNTTEILLPRVKQNIGYENYLKAVSSEINNDDNMNKELFEFSKELLQKELALWLLDKDLKVYWGNYVVKKTKKDTYIVMGYLSIPKEHLQQKYMCTFIVQNGKYVLIDRLYNDRNGEDPFNLF